MKYDLVLGMLDCFDLGVWVRFDFVLGFLFVFGLDSILFWGFSLKMFLLNFIYFFIFLIN